jgi:hypothetical protein
MGMDQVDSVMLDAPSLDACIFASDVGIPNQIFHSVMRKIR